MKATKNLALTADKSEVVDAKDKRARYLFAEKGQEIPDALARKYGLLNDEPEEDVEVKAQPKPEDKSRGKPETKPIFKPETK